MNTVNKTSGAIASIDWKLLKKQKKYLSELASKKRMSYENRILIDGVLILLDTIQDSAIADDLATELEVLGA